MKTILAVFLLVLASVTGSAQSQKNSEDTPDRKTLNGFGGHLFVVKDPRGFIEEWMKPKPPKINPVKEAKRGELLGAFVLFAGCKQDSAGVCNSEVDYQVLKPDGSVYAERNALPLWKEQAPPGQNIQLSRAILTIRVESKEPAGEYKVKAKVTDINANVTLELETTFRVR